MIRTFLLLLVASVPLSEPTAPEVTEAPDPRIVEVKMVDRSTTEFAFEPSEIEVRTGDVVRFIQEGVQPHNVEFKDTPDGATLGDEIRMGPYLMKKGEIYEIRIDDRFTRGEYAFVCTPHQFLGMTGRMVVDP